MKQTTEVRNEVILPERVGVVAEEDGADALFRCRDKDRPERAYADGEADTEPARSP